MRHGRPMKPDLDDLWKRQITREVLQERLIIARAPSAKKQKPPRTPPPANPRARKDPPSAAAPRRRKPRPSRALQRRGSEPIPKPVVKPKTPDTPEQKVLKRYDQLPQSHQRTGRRGRDQFPPLLHRQRLRSALGIPQRPGAGPLQYRHEEIAHRHRGGAASRRTERRKSAALSRVVPPTRAAACMSAT